MWSSYYQKIKKKKEKEFDPLINEWNYNFLNHILTNL